MFDICFIVQKSQTPTLDDLAIPQFESESRKTQIKVTNKVPAAPVVESTSVIPRQRPKAATSAPLNLSNLPIALNSSPTTIKTSQSPVFSNENTRSFSPKSGHTQQNFPTFAPATQSFPTTASAFPNQPNFFPSSQSVVEKDFDTLFQSTAYPDPFRDDVAAESNNTCEIGNQATDDTKSPDENTLLSSGVIGQGLPRQGKVESTSQCIVGGSNTPPSTPALSVPKGHRRNMSDTTAFNK